VARPVTRAALVVAALAIVAAGCARPAGPAGPARPGAKVPATPSDRARVQMGTASWYGDVHQGKKTASGEVYDMAKLTAAHRTLPLGTRVRVTNVANGRSVVVRINDRGPFVDDRIIDVSRAAARALGAIGAGLFTVRVEVLADAATESPPAAAPR